MGQSLGTFITFLFIVALCALVIVHVISKSAIYGRWDRREKCDKCGFIDGYMRLMCPRCGAGKEHIHSVICRWGPLLGWEIYTTNEKSPPPSGSGHHRRQ